MPSEKERERELTDGKRSENAVVLVLKGAAHILQPVVESSVSLLSLLDEVLVPVMAVLQPLQGIGLDVFASIGSRKHQTGIQIYTIKYCRVTNFVFHNPPSVKMTLSAYNPHVHLAIGFGYGISPGWSYAIR
mgnify:CR=1 FL=1